MNHRRPRPHSPPPTNLNIRHSAQLTKRVTSSFFSSFLTFVFVSLLLFFFRTIVEDGARYVTSFIDRDPSLKTLLYRPDAAHFRPSRAGGEPSRRLRRRPHLLFTGVGDLDDFLSGDGDRDRTLFGHNPKPQTNASFVRLRFSHSSEDSGIRFSEIVRPGLTFEVEGLSLDDDGGDSNGDRGEESGNGPIGSDKEQDRAVDFHFLIRGLDLDRHDAAALFFLVSFLSAAYGWAILGFLVTYSWILGIVFVAVVNDLLGRYSSCVANVWDGSRLGIKRLSGFILVRWAVRDAATQLLGLWFFGDVEDPYSFFRLFVRLKLMPFSVTSPWVQGFEKEIAAFVFSWFVVDFCLGFIFAVDSWVAIVDARRTGSEIVKEGCYLLSTMINQAVQLKCWEAILCGSLLRYALGRLCGTIFAAMFQSVMEVHFMIAWLLFYFAARCKEASSEGRTFGFRELEGLLRALDDIH